MASGQPERDPLVALCAGDPAPFEEFVRTHARTLIAFFRHQGASLNQAEDLTQDVFVKLYRNAARYRPQERFTSYCFRVARNVWIDGCRRAAARAACLPGAEHVSESEPASARPDPAARLVLEEEEHALGALLSELPPAHRRVFELVLLGELSYAEVSALLAIPVGTVKSRMFHAVRRLRVAWAEKCEREGVA